MDTITELIKDITPLNRYNVSSGLDQALDRIKRNFPDLVIHRYSSGTKVWNRDVPQKWDPRPASLSCDGKVLFRATDHPIRVWSGSWPTSKVLSYEQLLPHLEYDPDAPDLLP